MALLQARNGMSMSGVTRHTAVGARSLAGTGCMLCYAIHQSRWNLWTQQGAMVSE